MGSCGFAGTGPTAEEPTNHPLVSPSQTNSSEQSAEALMLFDSYSIGISGLT